MIVLIESLKGQLSKVEGLCSGFNKNVEQALKRHREEIALTTLTNSKTEKERKAKEKELERYTQVVTHG